MIVWLASYPRSGNTYLRMVIHQLTGLPTYSLYHEDWEPDIAALIGHKEHTEAGAPGETVRFVKSHATAVSPEHAQENSPAIIVVRDGRDACLSLAEYNVRKGVATDVQQELMQLITHNNWKSFEGWGWWHETWAQSQRKIEYVPFENLINAPNLFGSSAINLTVNLTIEEPIQLKPVYCYDFDKFHALQPSHFAHGKVGRWREHFTPQMNQRFWDNHGKQMERFGYEYE